MTKERVEPVALDLRLRELESSLITWALDVSGGNKSKAAALLQIKRTTLGDRINRCGLGHVDHDAGPVPQRALEPGVRAAGV